MLEVRHYRTSSNLIFFISDEIASAHRTTPRKDTPRLSLREAFFASKQSHLLFYDRKDEIASSVATKRQPPRKDTQRSSLRAFFAKQSHLLIYAQ